MALQGSSGSDGSVLSEDEYSHFSDYSHGSRSTLADLLERFTVDAQPDCTLKLRGTAGPVVLGADLTRVVAAKTNTAALVIKPSGEGQPWRRLRVDSGGTLTLRSRKLHWWLFTLDATGHANPFSRSFDLSYRVATKWDVAKGEYRNKKRFELGERSEARAHWTISYSLPVIEGSMGTAARHVNREVHADVGYAHLDIPRVELVVWPCGRPAAKAAPSDAAAAAGSSSAAVAGASEAEGGAAAAAPLGSASSSSTGGGQQQPQQQRQHLPEYLVGEGSGGTATATGSSAQRRKASLQQLNSHVACLSGCWWETFGRGRR